ncbi:hypothetical protein K443DRAFT_686195 [Laccaria amethystina LaAM-08-1]|uniref:Uncharacterized protein n=1 Tax=Laccaria amethystina LaAM-08-1 TaxID=1095629 RepID=A0A0C9WSW5_9AGAR|nr:hypothetical protein K443DRAFT_686195 [Laccaria amethystina LaAM-08-1]
MGNTAAASCAHRGPCWAVHRGQGCVPSPKADPPYYAYLLGSSTCSAPADRCRADSLGYIQK